MKPQIIDPATKEAIKNDIEHLFLPGLTTMNSISKTYDVPLSKISQFRDEVIEEMMDKHKMNNGKYIPVQRELMLGELAMGETFIPKEYEGTKYAHQLFKTIETSGMNVLVENFQGKQEWMVHNLKVIIKSESREENPASQ